MDRPPRHRRRHWWIPSFTASGLLHAALITSAFAVPFAVLRGRRVERLATLSSPPAPAPLAQLSEDAEPPRALGEVDLPDPELVSAPEPAEPEVEPEPSPAPEDPLRALPVEASAVRRTPPTTAFPPQRASGAEEPPPEEVASAAAPPSAPAPPEPPGDETDEEAPELIPELSPRPPYPLVAQRMRWEGAVVCRLTIGPEGSVVAAVLERSSGHDVLDRAALDGVRVWRFRPGTRGGLPVAMQVRKRILFQLAP